MACVSDHTYLVAKGDEVLVMEGFNIERLNEDTHESNKLPGSRGGQRRISWGRPRTSKHTTLLSREKEEENDKEQRTRDKGQGTRDKGQRTEDIGVILCTEMPDVTLRCAMCARVLFAREMIQVVFVCATACPKHLIWTSDDVFGSTSLSPQRERTRTNDNDNDNDREGGGSVCGNF